MVKGTPKKSTVQKKENLDLAKVQKEISDTLEMEIKGYYGAGGQTYSIIQIFGLSQDHTANNNNPLFMELLKELHSKEKQKNLLTGENGKSQLITFSRGKKNYYTLTIQSENLTFQSYKLTWGNGPSFLTYTEMEKADIINITKGNTLIINIGTNGGKIKQQQQKINTLFNLQPLKDIGNKENPLTINNKGEITYNNTTYKDFMELTNTNLLNNTWDKFHTLIK